MFRYCALFISLFLFFSISVSLGQDRFKIYGGYGFPEGLIIGPRIQFNRVQLGVGVGGRYDGGYYSLSGDVSYHFGQSPELSESSPWYIKGGVTKWFSHLEVATENPPLATNLRLGLDFNISKKFGLNIELGLLIGKGFVDDIIAGYSYTGIVPGFGIFFYYRL